MKMRSSLLIAISAAALLGACSTTYHPDGLAPVERIADQLPATGADRAQMLAANGNFEAAAALYLVQVNADPANVELKHKLAEAYRSAGNAASARAVFEEIAAIEGWQARGFEGLGRVAMTSGDSDGARQAFESATQADPWAWRSWLALAQLSDLAGNWEQADSHYAVALGASKEPAIVYNNLGISFMARGNPEYAAQLFGEALSHDPTLAKARTNLDLAEAAVGKSMPTNVSMDSRDQAYQLNNFAYVAQMQGRRDDAIQLYEAAIQKHPAFYAKAFNSLADLKRTPLQPAVKTTTATLTNGAPNRSATAPASQLAPKAIAASENGKAVESATAEATELTGAETNPQP